MGLMVGLFILKLFILNEWLLVNILIRFLVVNVLFVIDFIFLLFRYVVNVLLIRLKCMWYYMLLVLFFLLSNNGVFVCIGWLIELLVLIVILICVLLDEFCRFILLLY